MKTLKILCIAFLSLTLTYCTDDDTPMELNPDLEASSITFSVDPQQEFFGVATITGTVTNVGNGDFTSGEGQQGILLYERPLGAAAPGNLVNTVVFTSLNVGESLTVSFSRPWDASSPAEGEFPPEYILRVSYDPDIFIDGNDNNNDNNSSNNSLTVSGGEINTMF